MIKYELDEELTQKVQHIVQSLELHHDLTRIACIRSRGSSARRTLARCHALPRILQKAMGVKAHYAIEVISENFDRLNQEDQTKTIIHELMHIPKGMKGGFRYHDFVCSRNIEVLYKQYRKITEN